jgi:hypothetical protein
MQTIRFGDPAISFQLAPDARVEPGHDGLGYPGMTVCGDDFG